MANTGASGSGNYQVVLKAVLDTTGVQKQINDLQNKANKATKAATKAAGGTKQSQEASSGILATLGKTVGKTLLWGTAMGAVYGTLNQIRGGFEYILDLNKQMTDIQIVTGMSSEEIGNLALSYNQLAKEMGVTTLEVAAGTTEWFRQGKTIEETQELMRATLMLSKLGNIESAQSTEYLTSILNGFNMEASEAVTVVDKLIAVDNMAATSAAEVAKALQRSSNSAQQAGVSFETLVAYITTVSSVTRKSAESIGESFKTIFARMQNVKLGAWEEDAANLNDVERALHGIGMELRDTNGEFKSTEIVLNEVAARWEDLGTIERSAIANAIAGVRQRENFLVLMNNFNDVLDYQRAQYDSLGLATSRYQIYMENLEAAQNKFKSSWEAVWQKTITSKFIKGIYDFGAGVADLISAMGGLIPIAGALISTIWTLNAAFITKHLSGFIVNIVQTGKSFLQLIGIMKTAGNVAVTTGTKMNMMFGGIGIVISLATIAYSLFADAIDSGNQKLQESQDIIDEYSRKIEQTADHLTELTNLGDSFDVLRQKTELSSDEQERFTDLQNRIKTILPQVAGEYDNLGNYILDATVPLQSYIDLLKQQYQAEKDLRGEEFLGALDDRKKAYEKEAKNLSAMVERYEYAKAVLSKPLAERTGAELDVVKTTFDEYNVETIEDLGRLVTAGKAELDTLLIAFQVGYYNLNEDQKAYMISSLNDWETYGSGVVDILTRMMTGDKDDESTPEVIPGLDPEKILEEIEKYKPAIEKALSSLGEGGSIYLDKMFGDATGEAQLFFTGLVSTAAESLQSVMGSFQSGEMSIADYASELERLGNVFSSIGNMAISYSDTLGMSAEQLGQFKLQIGDSVNMISDGLRQVQDIQVLNAAVQDAIVLQNAEKIKFGTAEYNKYMAYVAKTAAEVGFIYQDTNGVMIQGAEDLTKFLTAGEGNFAKFSNQTAAKTGEILQKIVNGAGQMLVALTNSLKNFSFDISITPSLMWNSTTANILGHELPINIPTIKLTTSVDSTGSGFQGLMDAVSTFGSTLQGIDFNFDSSIYDIPSALGDVGGAMGGWNDIIGDTTGSMGELNDASREQIELLRDQLAEYKRMIDARKKLLMLAEEEIEYQEKLEKKQSDVAGIQSELLELAFDDSEEAVARRLALEEELALRQEELDKLQRQHTLEQQLNALDDEYENYKINIDAQIAEIETHHEGVGSGFVGGIKSNEQFAKLMDGELVLNKADMDKFMYNLPKMAQTLPLGQSGLTIGNLINIEGNVDESTIPSIQNIANRVIDEINRTMSRRGNTRSANSFSI